MEKGKNNLIIPSKNILMVETFFLPLQQNSIAGREMYIAGREMYIAGREMYIAGREMHIAGRGMKKNSDN